MRSAALILAVFTLGSCGSSATQPGADASLASAADAGAIASPDASAIAPPDAAAIGSPDASTSARPDASTIALPDAGKPSPSGEPMPVGDLPGWHQIFADDFDTDVPVGSFPDAVSAKWSAYPDGWKDTSKNGTYTPSKVISISGGVMTLHLHTENGVHMVSAPEPKLPGAIGSEGGQLYGRYAIRFRADPVVGYKTAWLLWPDSETWPRDGEIDFPEGDLDGTISAFMHRMNGTSGSDQDAYSTTAHYPTWHTAVIEWSATQCHFLLDGAVVGTSTSRIPATPMHYVIQTETALDGTVPADNAAGDVQIDWVAIWQPQ